MENRFENFTFRILQVSKLIQRIKNYEMKEFGLKAVHVMCIFYLHGNPQGLTNTELVKMTLEDKAAISRALCLLKEKGLIRGEEKRHKGLVSLTEEGERVACSIGHAAKKAVEAGGDGLTDENREIFYSSLNKIAENLEEYYKHIE